jgi:hypothetical protein
MPVMQHRPDRHRINEKATFANRKVFQRHGGKAHPGEDLVKAANSNGMIQRFGTFRLSPNAAATPAKRTAAATPDTPRENKGGHSRRRILIAAQFNAQPTEVTARKRKPVALADDELVMYLCLSQKGVHAAGISNLRYRCRPRRLRCWISETSRAPFR